ncbi:SAP domain-containing protein [Sedimenticola sp.]|uniref:SAP domain-containing protein n=1 Tax=Sedimenticola sp. TaxID=1940285 RepID=UPI003D139CA8
MNMQDVRRVAKDMGIKTGGISKIRLIHTIQLQEGNFDCFASDVAGQCDQWQCRWRDDCVKAANQRYS